MDRYRFRFWNEENTKWFYFGFETYPTYEEYIWKALTDGKKIYQCTNKKDEHNKTIFEGDLLLCFDKPDRDGWYCELLCEVIYDNQNASFSLKTIKYRPFGSGDFTSDSTNKIYNFSDVKDIVIFGNKFENPELLNKEI